MSSDAVIRFLRARGCPEDVVTAGLEGRVADWERTVDQVRHGYPLGLDDYLNDMDNRQLLEELIALIPEEVPTVALTRIEKADRAMKELLAPSDECIWGDAIAELEGWTAADTWWYFHLPRSPGAQMREELEEL